jgi:hypothetical protein
MNTSLPIFSVKRPATDSDSTDVEGNKRFPKRKSEADLFLKKKISKEPFHYSMFILASARIIKHCKERFTIGEGWGLGIRDWGLEHSGTNNLFPLPWKTRAGDKFQSLIPNP